MFSCVLIEQEIFYRSRKGVMEGLGKKVTRQALEARNLNPERDLLELICDQRILGRRRETKTAANAALV